MKSILIVAFTTALASFACASFDLVLITDDTNDVVHRIDGDSGTYLGSFGQGILVNPTSLVLIPGTSTVVVADSRGLSTLDYNTGQGIYTSASSGFVHNDMALTANGRFARSSTGPSTTAFRVSDSATGGVSSTNYTAPSTGTFGAIGVDSTGDIVVHDRTRNRILRYNPAISTGPEALSADGSFVIASNGAASGSTFIGLQADGSMVSALTQSFGATSQIGFAPSGVTFTSVVDAAFGHATYAWGLGKTAAGTRLQRYSRTNSAYAYSPLGGFNYAQIGNPTNMAVVIAPEPITLIGLAIPVLAMIRKRKGTR